MVQENWFTFIWKCFWPFITGADHPPPLGFYHKPEIGFTHDPERTLPTASTCTPMLYISERLWNLQKSIWYSTHLWSFIWKRINSITSVCFTLVMKHYCVVHMRKLALLFGWMHVITWVAEIFDTKKYQDVYKEVKVSRRVYNAQRKKLV